MKELQKKKNSTLETTYAPDHIFSSCCESEKIFSHLLCLFDFFDVSVSDSEIFFTFIN